MESLPHSDGEELSRQLLYDAISGALPNPEGWGSEGDRHIITFGTKQCVHQNLKDE